jgi:formylglycine-generating enzyme required for sulfatase activity
MLRRHRLLFNFLVASFFICIALSAGLACRAAISIDIVPVGNPGNPADTRYVDSDHPNGVGAVAYPFRMGKTEITNSQYVAMLNAVAVSDPYGLYSTFMSSETQGGIVRSGSPGTYTYAVKPSALSGAYTYANKPVVFVNSGDAMRFANWLQDGQPTGPEGPGTTETGAYTMNGAITDAALAAVTRNAGARWWLPNEDEWYKAAYHKNDGVTGNYWDYPTGADIAPNNNLPSADTANSANFFNVGYTTGNSSYPLTDAGAYTLSGSPYGTFDQGGNVQEWNETPFNNSLIRGQRGGSCDNLSPLMAASFSSADDPSREYGQVGFRVASIPEPSTAVLAVVACGAMLSWRRSNPTPSRR